MTWLSQLYPRIPGLQRLADKDHKMPTRQGKRPRRMMVLEILEHRTLLSNVTVKPITNSDNTITRS
jgi:hypothetical protein